MIFNIGIAWVVAGLILFIAAIYTMTLKSIRDKYGMLLAYIMQASWVIIAFGFLLIWVSILTSDEAPPPCDTITINDVEYIPVDCEATNE